MDVLRDSILGSFRYLTTMNVWDILDVLIIAFVIYKVIVFIQRTNSSYVAGGILTLVVIMWLSGEFGLNVVNFLLRKAVELGLIALVILFQPELRRMLEKMGSGSLTQLLGREVEEHAIDVAITQTVLACADMSRDKVGALVVFERVNRLTDPLTTGTIVNADPTAELLKNIFFNKAPLHDGAVIIRDGKILAAGCMLPMSSNTNLSKDLGMRHRAGIGASETSDCVVVICSEETGGISVAVDGMLKRRLKPETVETLLRQELLRDVEPVKTGFNLTKIFKVKKDDTKEK